MNKIGQFITTVVIGGFAVILIAMVVLTSNRAANPVNGSLHSALEKISAQNLHATAIAPADVYGDDWVGAAILCPGTDGDDVAAQLQVNAEDLGVDGVVGDNENFLVVVNAAGQAFGEKLDRSEVDLCASQVPGGFDARMMIPLVKDGDGAWTLVAN